MVSESSGEKKKPFAVGAWVLFPLHSFILTLIPLETVKAVLRASRGDFLGCKRDARTGRFTDQDNGEFSFAFTRISMQTFPEVSQKNFLKIVIFKKFFFLFNDNLVFPDERLSG